MFSVFSKEIHLFFSSLIGYIVISVFLISIGLFMWVFSDTSVLDYNFATMDQLFSIAPLVFLFLIPAITMRSFAEEKSKGTLTPGKLADFVILDKNPLKINSLEINKIKIVESIKEGKTVWKR